MSGPPNKPIWVVEKRDWESQRALVAYESKADAEADAARRSAKVMAKAEADAREFGYEPPDASELIGYGVIKIALFPPTDSEHQA